MPITLGTALGGTILNAGLGAYKSYQANSALKNLAGQPCPNYSLSPQLSGAFGMAQQNANHGFTAPQNAAFASSLAQNNNSAFQRASDQAGGNLSGSINAGINYGNVGALNQHASQDAAIQNQNRGQYYNLAGQVQNLNNMQSQAAIQHRQQLEQAYGGALQSSLNQVTQAPMQAAAIFSGMNNSANNYYGNGGGNSGFGGGYFRHNLSNNDYNNTLNSTRFTPNGIDNNSNETIPY